MQGSQKAIQQLRDGIHEILPESRYSQLFFEDLFNLWQRTTTSPEVIFREIKALEGLTTPTMQMDGAEDIPIWFLDSAPIDDRIDKETGLLKPDTYMKIGASATKNATQFTKDKSPLKGLWHKHYFVNEDDILLPNIHNENKKFHKRLQGKTVLHPTIALGIRIAEGALTGEWIIFEEKNDVKTYLCLAKHDDGDDAIAKRLVDAGIRLPHQL